MEITLRAWTFGEQASSCHSLVEGPGENGSVSKAFSGSVSLKDHCRDRRRDVGRWAIGSPGSSRGSGQVSLGLPELQAAN